MPDVSFPVSSTPGHLIGEGEGRLLNAFVEKAGATVYWRRPPGILTLADTGQTNLRGFLDVAGMVYAAYTGVVVRIALDNTVTVVGSLPGSDAVTWARNNRADGPDLCVTRETGGAYLVTPSSVAVWPDANLPLTVNSVTFGGGYFFWSDPLPAAIWASDLNSTVVNALSFATAESQPDPLVRVVWTTGMLFAFGDQSIEPWRNVGTSPFPLTRADTILDIGALTTFSIAGFEDGWGRSIFFVAADKTIRELAGYETNIISTPDVERFLQASTVSTIETMVYTARGHAIWTVTSDVGSWSYDVQTKSWHERQSAGLANWRATSSVNSNNRWIVGDRVSGKIGQFSEAVFAEFGGAISWTLESGPSLTDFPMQTALPRVDFDFTYAATTVTVVWSMDGGRNYLNPVVRSLAPDGNSGYPVHIDSMGQASYRGVRIRMTITDPVDFSFMGASCKNPLAKRP